MAKLIDYAISHARLTIALLIFLLLAGFTAYVTIPKEAEPDVRIPIIYVQLSQRGISPEDAERIFERFYRAKDPRVAKITGTGLGLTLAREVVRMHGGDITVESQIDQGSTFTMTLPLKAAA
jgi:signal transduction histidine kinase